MLELLKDMKKVSEDKKGVTMAHPTKGHSMTILFKGVTPVQKEALKRLPLYNGGELKGVHVSAYDSKDKELQGESEAGKQVRQSDLKASAKGKAKEEHERVLSEIKAQPKPKIQNFDDGGQATSEDTKPPVTVNVNSGAPSAAAQQGQVPIAVQQPNVNAQNPNVLLPNGSMSAPGAAQTGQQANVEQEKVDAAKAQAMVPIEEAKLQAQRQQAQQDQDNINALHTHADNLAANIKSINPNAAWDNMSDPKKVTTALGLFLGGLSVPFHGQNFAQDTLNKSLDRDVQSQIQNNDNQKTIFGAYNTLYNNQEIASKMAKASMADIYSSQAATIAQKLGTPQALANLHKVQSDMAVIKNKAILDSAGNLSSTPNNPRGGGSAGPVAPAETAQPNQPNEPQANQSSSEPESVASQYIHGRLGSTPAASASIPKETEQPEKNPVYKILSPDAESKLHGSVQYGAPAARADYPSVLEQYTKAQQAEKVLNGPKGDGQGGIHDLMKQMYANTGSGSYLAGLGSHIRNNVTGALAAVPEIGPALVGASRLIPRTESQKAFDSNKSVMETDLANALQGLVAPTDIQKIVEANLPAYGDTPKDIEEKTKKIVNMVIKGTKTSQLQSYKMTK